MAIRGQVMALRGRLMPIGDSLELHVEWLYVCDALVTEEAGHGH